MMMTTGEDAEGSNDQVFPQMERTRIFQESSRGSLRSSKIRLKQSLTSSYRSLDGGFKDKGFWTSLAQDERLAALSNYVLLASLCTTTHYSLPSCDAI